MRLSPSTLRSTAISVNAHSTPVMLPRPPNTLTPPSRAAVITSSSMPTALSARALDSRAVNTMPAMAHTTPEVTNSASRSRWTRMPE